MAEPPRQAEMDSPTAGTPEDKYPKPSATLKGPPLDMLPIMGFPEQDEPARRPPRDRSGSSTTRPRTASDKQDDSFSKEPSPPLTKELTLFLQYKSKVKKFVLPEGYSELSMGKLQLAFIEKFSWNTHNNGADLHYRVINNREICNIWAAQRNFVTVADTHFDECIGDAIRPLVQLAKCHSHVRTNDCLILRSKAGVMQNYRCQIKSCGGAFHNLLHLREVEQLIIQQFD